MHPIKLFSSILLSLILGLPSQNLPDSVKSNLNQLSPSEQVDYLIELSWDLREKESENALIYGRKAIKMADSLNLRPALGRASNFVGVILLHYNYRLKEAVPYFHTAMEIALAENDSLKIGYAYNNLGDVYYLTGNIPLALEYANRSMEFIGDTGDSLAIAYAHINYGYAYRYNKQYEKALDHFFKAIEIREKLGNKLGVASAFREVGIVYYELGNYDKALEYYREAYQKNKEISNKKWMAFSLEGIGKVYYQQNNYKQALERFSEAEKLHEERKHNFGIIGAKLGKALVYSKTNQTQRGVEELERAKKLAEELGVATKILETFETITKFYLNVNNLQQAGESLDSFMRLYDSLYSAQQFETLAELETNYEMKRTINENQRDIETKKEQQIYLIIIISLMVILIVVIFWKYRSYKQLTKELRESNSSKDQLFSIISHDLRNPFFTLMGYIDLLKQKDIDKEDLEEVIESLDTTTHRTYSLLENLLNLSASRRGKIEYHPTKIDLKKLIENVLFSLDSQIKKKSLSVELNVPSTSVFADEKMMEIIFRNLISNAIKYNSEKGSIKINFNKGKMFCVTISDTGLGINEELKESLFKTEFTKSQKGTAGEKGTGIGLSLCKEFVEKHNGTIELKSELGKGSSFTICIPQKS